MSDYPGHARLHTLHPSVDEAESTDRRALHVFNVVRLILGVAALVAIILALI